MYSTIFFAALEIVISKFASYLFEPYCKVQDNVEERRIRSAKAAACIYKTLYYTWATAWGYLVLKDQPYFPTLLGGSGEFNLAGNEFPYFNFPDQLKEYILIT